MLLVLEIALTIAAWRRGWKAWALLPLAVGAGVAFTGGVLIGAVGGSVEEAMVIGALLDVVCIGILIGMIVKRRRPAVPESSMSQNPQKS